MPSFLNLTNYLKNPQAIQGQRLETLHKLLFGAPFSGDITFSDFESELKLSGPEVVCLLKDLIAAKVLEWGPVECGHCTEQILEPQTYCHACGEKITDRIKFHIGGCINESEEQDFKSFPEKSDRAKQFASRLCQKGCMYYLLIDLAESESLQSLDSLAYNKFLDKVRVLMKQEGLSQAPKGALSFGEIGDCLKLAFLDAFDFVATLENFAMALGNEKLNEQFPTLKGKETKFPRFDGVIGKIDIPEYYKEPEKMFCITLNGAIDFNDYELTRLFRFDHKIKTDRIFFDDDTFIALWVQEEIILKDLKWEGIPVVCVTDNTHRVQKKERFGLFGFTKDGECLHESVPRKYKK